MTGKSPDNKIEPRYALVASGTALVTVTILILIKVYGYLQSDSAAVMATLTDSAVDAAISLMMLVALRYSLRPADRSHRYGHGKMEGVAALFQGAFLAGAGIFLLFDALRRFADSEVPTNFMLGIAVSGISIVLSLILVSVQKYCLKRAPSLAVEADQVHYKTDIVLNVSVMATLMATYYGGPLWLDPACAILIAGYFALAARKIALQAIDMLLDRELPEAVRTKIKDIISKNQDVLGFHDLRTRKSGMILHISFDVEVDPALSLKDAHEITRVLEQDILDDYPYAEIIIHKDPYGDTHDARHSPGISGH